MLRKAILLLTLTLTACNPSKSAVPGCNASEITDTIVGGTVYSWEEKANKIIAEHDGLNSDRRGNLQRSLSNWESKITSIRQIRYDADNDVRWCVAEFAYTDYPTEAIAIVKQRLAMILLMELAVTGGRDNDSTASRKVLPDICVKTVEYKIENLLDKPGEHWISWWCRPRVFEF